MQSTTETFATLNTFETLSQQELMDVNGGDWRNNICKWTRFCQYIGEANTGLKI